jgi:RecA/RadA recombinase
MFYPDRPMATLSPDVTAAVTSLQARWGTAAPRIAGATDGALALAPLQVAPALVPLPGERPRDQPRSDDDRVIHTGFAALDAILGPGGLPRSASVAIRGDGSSGRTTLALRLAAEAQAQGSVVAWLDLARSFDPVEAAARGINLEWLVVITPATLDEGLAIAGSLLTGRSVDLLFLDLPGGRLAPTDSPARIADRLGRLAAFARRSDAILVVLETLGPGSSLSTAVAEATGLRLELARRSWIRLGRDVVGQRTEALVARNRYGPPGKRATLRILYAEGGERDACLRLEELLLDELPIHAPAIQPERTHRDATHPPPPAAPSPPARSSARLTAVPAGTRRAGWPAVGPGAGHRREPGGPGAGRPARDAARERTPARP